MILDMSDLFGSFNQIEFVSFVKNLLHFFHQFKAPLLLYIRILFVIYLGQKHPLLPNPKRIVPVKPAVNHIFFLCLRMKSHIFNDVILVLKMLIYPVDFYFSFFHHHVSFFENLLWGHF